MLTRVKKAQVSKLEKCPSYQDNRDCPAVSLAALGKGLWVVKALFLGSPAQF